MPASESCYCRTNPFAPRLIESYCAACGLLIAASPWPKLLQKIEAVHICPLHGHYSSNTASQATEMGWATDAQAEKI